jgi:hypothetical protein
MEAPPNEPAAEKMWRWASANVMYELLYECMYCKRKINIQKRVASKPIKKGYRNHVIDFVLTYPFYISGFDIVNPLYTRIL